MGLEVAVVVATFGAPEWIRRADRAAASAETLAPAELVRVHLEAGDLADARNAGAASTTSPWICFLDADDELEAGYLEAMAATGLDRGLLAPAIREIVAGEPVPEPRTLAARNIATMNPCVVGTLLRRDVFDRAGGFWRERGWEDWSLFRRCWLLGEPVVHVPDAVYRIHVDPSSRNRTIRNPRGLHRQITQSHEAWNRRRRAAERSSRR